MKSLALLALIATLTACPAAPAEARWNPLKQEHRLTGEENARRVLQKMNDADPGLRKILDQAAGWAVFPSVGKVGMVVGGAGGNGRVYRKGDFIGTATMSQFSVGFQLGGQVYSEVIVFRDEAALGRFEAGTFAFDANVSAIVVDAGAGAKAGFKDGTLVLVLPQKGLMYEAALAGQKFTFKQSK